MRIVRILLVIVAVVCLGVALSYPLRYRQAQEKNDTDLEELARMRQQVRQSQVEGTQDRPQYPTFRGQHVGDSGGESTPSTGADARGGDAADIPGEAPSGASDVPAGEPYDDAAAGNGQAGTGSAGDTAGRSADTGSGDDAAGHSADTGSAGDAAGRSADVGSAGDAAGRSEEGRDGAAGPEKPAEPTPVPTPTPEPTREPNYWDLGKYYAPTPSPTPKPKKVEGPTIAPTPTPDRSIRKGPLPYALKEKVTLDKAAILPELKDIYTLNNDLIGWINIPDTVVDYPVVQAEDGEYYLTHDFYGEENINGQIILDVLCDPYTPSYNLVVSGHHMKNGTMFGGLPQYRVKSYWEKHPFLEFDTLMERKLYVIFACFYSADYDEDETGFRYNAIIDYKIDADRWLAEIEENQLYDTGIERDFGDEFITLTTCDRARHRNGSFVVVGRKIREGETFE